MTKRLSTSKKRPLSKILALGKRSGKGEVFSAPINAMNEMQLKMLRIQQGIWHSKKRVIIIFEGFDAAGKGGVIKKLTETLDPRSFRVNPIGPPSASEQGKHYLYRFLKKLPEPGMIAIFDRSWYGRVLVERVKKLTTVNRWKQAYLEIKHFEEMLTNDGIEIIKIFLSIQPDEQLRRFEARLKDPYKQWKLNFEDIEANKHWDDYVNAADDMLSLTNCPNAPWHVIEGDSKDFARFQVLKTVTNKLSHHSDWIEDVALRKDHQNLKRALAELKKMTSRVRKR